MRAAMNAGINIGIHIGIVLFFPALVLTSFFQARADDRAEQTRAAIALYDLQRAQVEAAGFCRELGCGRAVGVSVEEDERFPESVAAHTTRDESGTACVLHMRRRNVTDSRTIAHEVCHCAGDWEVLGRYGYVATVSKEERRWREEKAKACGEGLMAGLVAGR